MKKLNGNAVFTVRDYNVRDELMAAIVEAIDPHIAIATEEARPILTEADIEKVRSILTKAAIEKRAAFAKAKN